jgi:hypothetical protein
MASQLRHRGREEKSGEESNEEGVMPPPAVPPPPVAMPINYVYSPSDIRALLTAFYSRVNPEKLTNVAEIAAELEARIATQCGEGGGRRREVVYSEIARLNARLRSAYNGHDLSLFVSHAPVHTPQQRPWQEPSPESMFMFVFLGSAFLLAVFWMGYAVLLELNKQGYFHTSSQPHLRSFPPHSTSGWRQQVADKRISLDMSLEDLYNGKQSRRERRETRAHSRACLSRLCLLSVVCLSLFPPSPCCHSFSTAYSLLPLILNRILSLSLSHNTHTRQEWNSFVSPSTSLSALSRGGRRNLAGLVVCVCVCVCVSGSALTRPASQRAV